MEPECRIGRKSATLTAIAGLAAAFLISPTAAQDQKANPNPIFPVPPAVTFLTGDSWNQGGTTVRLYGVQSCIRGTPATLNGKQADCGGISMTYLANFIKNAPTVCQGIGQTKEPPQYLVVCKSEVDGNALDLGASLILKGFAFASVDINGKPINIQYALAEEEAKKSRDGLWSFDAFAHPNIVMKTAIDKAKKQ